MEPEDPELNGDSPSGELEPWVRIQSHTFTNWINDKLRILDLGVEDLAWDFRDGQKLCRLVEVIRGGRLGGRVIAKAKVNQYEARSNISMALQAVASDGVKLVNIGAEDIAGGNLKLILGMVWTLIRRYQIGSQTRLPPKKLMLSWINATLHPFMEVSNFSSDLNDGVALHGVIEYCRPGSCPDWHHIPRGDRLSNCQNGLGLANELFDIPFVVSPEDFSSHHLDELSGMTYLSYFMAEGGPGFQATLGWAQTHTSVSNFDRDWNNGFHICELVQSLGATVPGWPSSDSADWIGNIKAAIGSGKEAFGLSPVIAAVDMMNPEVDHIGVMAYIAWLQQTTKFRNNNKPEPVIEPEPEPVIEPEPAPRTPTPPPIVLTPPPPDTAELRVTVPSHWRLGSTSTLLVNTRHEGRGDITASSHSPTGGTTPLLCHRVDHYTHHVSFTPDEKGVWTVSVQYEAREAVDNPCSVNVFDPSLAIITRDDVIAKVGEPYTIQVNCRDVGHGDISAHVVRSGEIVPCRITNQDLHNYVISFVPHETGSYSVALFCGGADIPGTPMDITASTPTKVRFGGIETIGHHIEEYDHNEADELSERASLVEDKGVLTVTNDHVVRELDRDDSAPPLPPPISPSFTSDSSSIVSVEVSPRNGATNVAIAYGEKSTSPENSGGPVYILRAVQSHSAQAESGIHSNGPRTEPVRIEMSPTATNEQIYPDPKMVPYATMQINGNRQFQFENSSSQAGSYATHSGVSRRNDQSGQFIISSVMPSAPVTQTKRPCPVHSTKHITIPLRLQAGTPIDVTAKGVPSVSISGVGLTEGLRDKESSFEVDTRSSPNKTLECTVRGPSGMSVSSRTENTPNHDRLRVFYTPTETGAHQITLLYDGMEVNGSPFEAEIKRPVVYVKNLNKAALLGRSSSFQIDASEMNKGTLEIDSDLPIREYTKTGQNFYQVTFVPKRAGKHDLVIKYNNIAIDGCPFEVNVREAT